MRKEKRTGGGCEKKEEKLMKGREMDKKEGEEQRKE